MPRASVAQWIRHRPPKPRIVGSSPTRGTKLFLQHKINAQKFDIPKINCNNTENYVK